MKKEPDRKKTELKKKRQKTNKFYNGEGYSFPLKKEDSNEA